MVNCSEYLAENYNDFVKYTTNLKGRKSHIPASEIVNDVYLILTKKEVTAPDYTSADYICRKYLYNTSLYTWIDSKNKYRVTAPAIEYNFERTEFDNGIEEIVYGGIGQAKLDPIALDYTTSKKEILKKISNQLNSDDSKLFDMLMFRYMKLEDVRDATGVSLGHLHNIKKEFKNLINLTKI